MSRNPIATELKASIIIVAWRLVDELQECLDAVAASIDAPSHEVIVVLNGTSLETARVANEHPAVSKVIERFANIGFGAACNLAAQSAIGTDLIFLNDDTRVDCMWLTTIVAASSAHGGRSAVASLMLNYDGTVQEAGSRLLSHGGTLQWGATLTRAEAESEGLLEPREVDYGSAAALLVKRADFEWLGGFDPIFEPAYFEDVDLQLRLREIGVTVWLEPQAIVLHHSGRSTANDHWFRQFAANRSGYRFIERWAGVLLTAPAIDDPSHNIATVEPRNCDTRTVSSEISVGDDSLKKALVIARDYEDWLSTQLDQLQEFHFEISSDPNAPKRRELIDRVSELTGRVSELTDRLVDVEHRNLIGLTKMRIGAFRNKWLLSRNPKRDLTN
jgi:GT2 family glycosyltransferase